MQSIDNFKEHSKSAGFSVSTSPKFKGTIGSIGGSVGRMDSKLKSVTDQAGIFAGDKGYNISTGNTTSLKGSIISSKADKDKNSLTTRHLDIKNIQNEAEYTVRDNGLQYNNFGSSKTKSKKEFDKIYKHIGLTPTGGVGAHGKSSSITKSAISDGKIIENGRMVDIKTINTDIEHSLNELQAIFDKKSIEEKQQLAHLFSVNANEAIHQIAKHEGWEDGDPRKVALHGLVGGTTAKIGGGQFSDGVYAAGLSEAMMPQFKKWAGKIKGPDGKEYVDPEHLQQIAFVFGYATNELSGKSGQSGAYVSHMGAKHNFSFSPPSLDEVKDVVLEGINKFKEGRQNANQEEVNKTLNPEPPVYSANELGEAAVSATKSGDWSTEEAQEYNTYVDNKIEEGKAIYETYQENISSEASSTPLEDRMIDNAMQSEDDQFKSYAVLAKRSSSDEEKKVASASLEPTFEEARSMIPDYNIPDINSPEYITFLKKNLVEPAYFDSDGFAHYKIKDKNGMTVDLKGDYVDTYKSYNIYNDQINGTQEKIDRTIDVLDNMTSIPYIGGVSKTISQFANGYKGALEFHNAVYQWKVNNKIYNSYDAGQMNKYVLYKGGSKVLATFAGEKVGKDKVEQAVGSFIIATASDKGGEYLYNKASENTPNKFIKDEKEAYDQIMNNINDYTEVDK